MENTSVDGTVIRHADVASLDAEQGMMESFFTSIFFMGMCSLPALFLFVVLAGSGFLRKRIPILLYRGLALSVIAAIIHTSVLWWSHILVFSDPSFAAATVVLGWALNVTFLVIIPVTVDRSVTIYLLGRLSRRSSGLSHDELRDSLVTTFVDEYDGVGRRMQEQIASGTVIGSSDGRFALTAKGERFLRFGRAIGKLFGVDTRFIG